MNRFVKYYVAATTAVGSLAMPLVAFGQQLPPGQAVTLSTIQRLIGQVVNFLFAISAVAAMGVLLYGGLSYMGVLGEERQGKAKDIIWNGIIGIAIVLAVGLIIRTITNLITSQSLF